MEATELKANLKTQIIQYLNLLDIIPEEIKDDTPLLGEELGLESVELMVERDCNIKINNPTKNRKILVTVNQIAVYIIECSDEIQ